MRRAARALLFLLATLGALPAAAGGPERIDWPALAPRALSEAEARLRGLSNGEGMALSLLARLTRRAADPAAGERIADAIDRLRADLRAGGRDPDALLAALEALRRPTGPPSPVNRELSGRLVSITGFALDAPPGRGGAPRFYLVPTPAMCSHVAPPPRNQAIRVDGLALAPHHAPRLPVRVSGVIAVEDGQDLLFVLDGPVEMRAAYALDGRVVETVGLEDAFMDRARAAYAGDPFRLDRRRAAGR